MKCQVSLLDFFVVDFFFYKDHSLVFFFCIFFFGCLAIANVFFAGLKENNHGDKNIIFVENCKQTFWELSSLILLNDLNRLLKTIIK